MLKAKGGEISEENAAGGLAADMQAVIQAIDICWKENGTESGKFKIQGELK